MGNFGVESGKSCPYQVARERGKKNGVCRQNTWGSPSSSISRCSHYVVSGHSGLHVPMELRGWTLELGRLASNLHLLRFSCMCVFTVCGFSWFPQQLGFGCFCFMESLLISTSLGNTRSQIRDLLGQRLLYRRLGYGMQFVNGFFTGMYSGKIRSGNGVFKLIGKLVSSGWISANVNQQST